MGFGLSRKYGGLVAKQVRYAAAADVLQNGLDCHRVVEGDRLWMHGGRRAAVPVDQRVTSFRFAPCLNAQRRRVQQLHRDIRYGTPALELQLDPEPWNDPVLALFPDYRRALADGPQEAFSRFRATAAK